MNASITTTITIEACGTRESLQPLEQALANVRAGTWRVMSDRDDLHIVPDDGIEAHRRTG